MDETVLLPSPNWFQVSVMTVSPDGWLVYGGPSKSLCVLEPFPADYKAIIKGNSGYKAHVINRAHPEKIVSVDLSPEWPAKKLVLTGSADGLVKQWSVTEEDGSAKIKISLVHEVHSKDKEQVAGVGYSNEVYAVSVGVYGNIVKWDVNSNVVKTYGNFMKSFKPNCMSCSRHAMLNVAVGTKQGVVFVIDLNGQGKILYKVRAHDEEIINLSWCPQYEVEVKKALKDVATGLAGRLEKIRNEPDDNDAFENNAVALNKTPKPEKNVADLTNKEQDLQEPEIVQEDDMFDIYKDHEADEFGHKKYQPENVYIKVKKGEVQSDFLAECLKLKGDILKLKTEPEPSIESLVDALDNTHVNEQKAESNTAEKCVQDSSKEVKVEQAESGDTAKVEDTESVDKAKDDQAESGDKAIVEQAESGDKAKVDQAENGDKAKVEHAESVDKAEVEKAESGDKAKVDQAEKGDKAKVEQTESSDKAKVDQAETGDKAKVEKAENSDKAKVKLTESNSSSVHIHRHLLATIGKYGAIRVWSKSGKLVSSCSVANSSVKGRNKVPGWVTLLWYKPDQLLIADGKSQLLHCDPTTVDSKNKLAWHPIHNFHKRGLYSITSSAPKVLLQSTKVEDWPIWTVAQDRNVIQYALKERKVLSVYNTCGGFVYTAETCPYDARRTAASVGDGAIRVWEADTLGGDESILSPGHVNTYWQNVQGKVLTVAWHPTRENLLAFATAEARVGLIETSARSEKPAKVLRPVLNSGVYGLCWGADHDLYACGGGELVLYRANNVDEMPTPIQVELEGKQWKLSEVKWTDRALLVGSTEGAVAALAATQPHVLLAAAFPYTKLIHCIEWHPQQVSESSEESPNKNLIATCALEKHGQIVILELAANEDGEIKLSTWKTLTGHKGPVLRVAWNPHREAFLVSTSQDTTVRVWDVTAGMCTSIFAGHSQATLGVAWSGQPSLADVVLSGGGDCSLRLWRTGHHPADKYVEPKMEPTKKEKKKNKESAAQSAKEIESLADSDDENKQVAANQDKRVKGPKKFLFPIMHKEINQKCLKICKAMLKKYIEKNCVASSEEVTNGIGNENTNKDKTNGNKTEEVTNGIQNGADSKEDNNNGNVAEEVINGIGDGDAEKQEEECSFYKIFGSINEVNEVLDAELARHIQSCSHEAWIMASILRGNIDSVFQYASQRDLVCPFLLSIAPSVSFKYWKDATQLYLAQIDRLVAKGEADKLCENRQFGGPLYRKVATLLSIHDVKGAVAVLTEALQFKEAYVLCRVRHMDSIAEETLQMWAEDNASCGALAQAAVCYLAMGDLGKAASALAKTNKEENLSLAAEIAKLSGQTTYADHIAQKNEQIKLSKDSAESVNIEETLKELPSRIELLMKEEFNN